MVFSSLIFLCVFLPLHLLFYFLVPGIRAKNGVLIVFSLIFYAWGEPVWIVLLLVSASADYLHGLIIERYRGRWQSKAAVVSSLVINLGLLAVFKYSGFLVENLNRMAGLGLPVPDFSLPIGISFYTFQTLSYTFDVYRGEVKGQRSFFRFLLFVSLFHQLVAGPIVRYKDIAREIDDRKVTLAGFGSGINRFVVGLAKKVVLANTAGEIAAPFLQGDLTTLPAAAAWLGIFLFALQIYFDFSGYSDMAIGLGRMFGFTYKENFDYPYASRSATEFWRRWHISLGSFFRDYLYIPLGGNRRFALRNLFAVWFLTGMWHGASWNFIFWGLYYGVLIGLERLVRKMVPFRLPPVLGHLYFIVITLLGWTLFYFEDGGQLILYFQALFGAGGWIDPILLLTLRQNLFFLVAATVLTLPVIPGIKAALRPRLPRQTVVWGKNLWIPLFNLAALTVSIGLLVGQSYNPFLYFRF